MNILAFDTSLNKTYLALLFNGKIYRHTLNPQYSITTECDKVIYYSVTDDDYGESFYGLRTEFIDIAYIFRLILENCADDDEIIFDFEGELDKLLNSVIQSEDENKE